MFISDVITRKNDVTIRAQSTSSPRRFGLAALRSRIAPVALFSSAGARHPGHPAGTGLGRGQQKVGRPLAFQPHETVSIKKRGVLIGK